MLKKLFIGAIATLMALPMLAVSTPVVAAQLSSITYLRMYSQGSARSDGIYQHRATDALIPFVKSMPQGTLGKAIYIDFTAFGDGEQTMFERDGTAAVGTISGGDGTIINHFTTPAGQTLAFAALEAQTLFPDMDAGSLDIAGDQTDDEGYEIYLGMDGADGAPFIVGYDPAFYTCVTAAITDVSGSDDFWMGFRRAEFSQPLFNSYADYAAIGPIAGDVYTETDKNASGTEVSTDTTLNVADGAGAKKYCVYVSAAGVVTYKVDGAVPPTTAAFTFDDGDPVIPFVHMLNAVTLSDEVDVYAIEVGYQ